jgi:rare lipoprotein A
MSVARIFLVLLSITCLLFVCIETYASDRTKTSSGTSSSQLSKPGQTAKGVASWYGQHHHGRRTASGEIFNQHRFTAAHRTLPFGTKLAVTNLRNGKSVEVQINDRGPFIRSRLIDLSYAAARALGLVKFGKAPVKVEVLRFP